MASESMLRRVLGSLTSISENGYRIQTPEPLDSGMDLRLGFELADSGALEIEGKAGWPSFRTGESAST